MEVGESCDQLHSFPLTRLDGGLTFLPSRHCTAVFATNSRNDLRDREEEQQQEVRGLRGQVRQG